MNEIIALFLSGILPKFLMWVGRTWFLFLPIFLGYLFWVTWVNYVRARYIKELQRVLLEIKIPRDISKSPYAMEAVLTSLYTTYKGSDWNRYMKGYLPTWYSLEVASIAGNIHFFVNTEKFFRNFVESQFYSQYPDAEIVEVSDYTYAFDFNLQEWDLWGGEFSLSKPDPYPIKTYVDFGLHETATKEEQKVDPVVSFLEFLGSMKEGEQVWCQIMIRGAGSQWAEDGRTLVKELMEDKDKASGEGKDTSFFRKTKGEQEAIASIERNISKVGFETGIRMIYLGKRDVFSTANMAALVGLMTQYTGSNSFKRSFSTPASGLFAKRRSAIKKEYAMDAFRKRSYFYWPYPSKPFVFNAEELATVYHFPGRVAETPTFGRVESKKGEPPATLPI